jgi:putative toxin-antitoxin system antitoxin component (TIGR02293 family)
MMNTAVLDRPTSLEPSGESVYTLIGKLLGLKISSEVDLIDRLEKGITSAAVNHLRARAPLTDAETFQLIAPRRTLSRREASGQRLTPEEADKTVRVARVTARARLAFAGQSDYAAEWMRESKSALGDRTPLQVLTTEFGALAIEELLVGIEHGMFA